MKEYKTNILHARLSPELMESLRMLAAFNRRKITSEVEIALEGYLIDAKRLITERGHDASFIKIDRGEQN